VAHVLCGVSSKWEWTGYRDIKEAQGHFVGTATVCQAAPQDCDDTPFHYFWYQVSEGYGKYCVSGYKVYCNTYSNPYEDLEWKGTAPWCAGDCSSDFVEIARDDAGDGSHCDFGTKALCVKYKDTSAEEIAESAEEIDDSAEEVTTINNGVDVGFYVYFGDDFDDEYLIEKNRTLLDDFASATTSAMNLLVPDVNTSSNISSFRAVGFTSVRTDFDELANASLVFYANIQFLYSTEEEAMMVSSNLSDSVSDTFNEDIEAALQGSLFDDLEYDYSVYFVEAGQFVTERVASCLTGSNESGVESLILPQVNGVLFWLTMALLMFCE